uniref:Esterase/lipase superfamily enzyme n=1 Tax=Candidatus Kentrum sp. UNK TaxID=2126344 RepID=A0A451A308_9GAMM|nr:MAG: Esterase/lipase superfamily enzyme [Candidatus Kentron sp. UNK]VFK69256.1 MAG: Esterase/lipase superfamily enzyme [Candidatus Kentron sp. UNK]
MKALTFFSLLLLIGSIAGCVANRDTTDRHVGIKLKPNYAVVNVFFGTDREENIGLDVKNRFGLEQGEIKYGTAKVSIPRDHRMGELEKPSILRLEFRENPEKHVVLLNISTRPKDKYFEELASKIRSSAKRSAFIFVHGYNVSFEEAAKRTAQISYDLAFEGAPVFYSWPSQGKIASYTIDKRNVEWAEVNLKAFLDDFLSRSSAQNVYLVAHSMGNLALTGAVVSLLDDKPEFRSQLTEIILTAPDIDADVFKRDIAPALLESKTPVTLYASSEDKALLASKEVHGHPRVGDSSERLVIVQGIETIDATGANTSFLGHSYFADTKSVLSDLFYLIRDGLRANQRFGLSVVNSPAGRYWKIKE